MNEALWLLLAALFALLGMGWLALSMDVHWRQVYPRHEYGRWANRLRLGGSAAVLLSGFACLEADHVSMAVLVWIMLLAAAALIIAMSLAAVPRLLLAIGPHGPVRGLWLPIPLLAMLLIGAVPVADLDQHPQGMQSSAVAVAAGAGERGRGFAALADDRLAGLTQRVAYLEQRVSSQDAVILDKQTPRVPMVGEAVAARAAMSGTRSTGGGHEANMAEIEENSANAVPGLVRDYVAGLRARFGPPRYPSAADRLCYGNDALVYFVIGRDGTLLERQLVQSSGDWRSDAAALERVRNSRPFPPLPTGLPQEPLALVLPIAARGSGSGLYGGPCRPWSAPPLPPAFPSPWLGMPYPDPR